MQFWPTDIAANIRAWTHVPVYEILTVIVHITYTTIVHGRVASVADNGIWVGIGRGICGIDHLWMQQICDQQPCTLAMKTKQHFTVAGNWKSNFSVHTQSIVDTTCKEHVNFHRTLVKRLSLPYSVHFAAAQCSYGGEQLGL